MDNIAQETIYMEQKQELMALRAEAGLDQLELAEAARVDQSTISLMESKKRPVRRATALKVFYALNRERKKQGLPEASFDAIDWYLVD